MFQYLNYLTFIVQQVHYTIYNVWGRGLYRAAQNIPLCVFCLISVGVLASLFYVLLFLYSLTTILVELSGMSKSEKLLYRMAQTKRILQGLGCINNIEVYLLSMFIIVVELPTIMANAGGDLVNVAVSAKPGAIVLGVGVYLIMFLSKLSTHYRYVY